MAGRSSQRDNGAWSMPWFKVIDIPGSWRSWAVLHVEEALDHASTFHTMSIISKHGCLSMTCRFYAFYCIVWQYQLARNLFYLFHLLDLYSCSAANEGASFRVQLMSKCIRRCVQVQVLCRPAFSPDFL